VTAYVDILINTSSKFANQTEPIGLFLFVGHIDTVAVGEVRNNQTINYLFIFTYFIDASIGLRIRLAKLKTEIFMVEALVIIKYEYKL
jgi:hypothetical protein